MFSALFSASLRGFEPPAYRLGGGRSIQLSYSDSYKIYISFYLLPFSFASWTNVFTLSQETAALSSWAAETDIKLYGTGTSYSIPAIPVPVNSFFLFLSIFFKVNAASCVNSNKRTAALRQSFLAAFEETYARIQTVCSCFHLDTRLQAATWLVARRNKHTPNRVWKMLFVRCTLRGMLCFTVCREFIPNL